MIRVCSSCKRIMGEKEPLENKAKTHGYCEGCLDAMFPMSRGTWMVNPRDGDRYKIGE